MKLHICKKCRKRIKRQIKAVYSGDIRYDNMPVFLLHDDGYFKMIGDELTELKTYSSQMQTEYSKGDRVYVIGTLADGHGGWDGVFTKDMYASFAFTGQKRCKRSWVVMEDFGLKKGVRLNDGNIYPHRVLELTT